jgi:hypothetical protein
MKPAISTTALVTMLLGTGILVFNALGLSVSLGEVAQTKGMSPDIAMFNIHGTIVHAFYLDLWTLPQRLWMTVGCLLIVGGKLGDARFRRG